MDSGNQSKKQITKALKDYKQVKFIEKQTIFNQKNLKKKHSKNYLGQKTVQKSQTMDINQDKFQIIYESFYMFFTKILSFNQFVSGLKFIGLSLKTQADFQKIFHIYNQNDQEMNFNRYFSIALELLKEQKQKKPTIQQLCIKKAFYHIIAEGNQLNRYSNIYQNVNQFSQQYQVSANIQKQVQKLPKQARFISVQTLKNIRNYLNRSDISDQDLQQVFNFQKNGNQTYLTQQSIFQMMNYNKIS